MESVDGSIYVLDGTTSERRRGTFDNNERFNPITNTWTIEAAMPTARHGLGVASIDGKICLIGGEPNPGSTVSWKNEI